jgi:hypothetical protein
MRQKYRAPILYERRQGREVDKRMYESIMIFHGPFIFLLILNNVRENFVTQICLQIKVPF